MASGPERSIVPRLVVAGRTFAPSVAATLATLLGVALLAALGGWQLDRARQQRAQLESFARPAAQPQALPPADAAGSLARYAHVRLAGHYLPERQFLLDNMIHAGVAGVRVLTPFVTDGGATVLVDRGWLPLGPSRARLPPVAVGGEARVLSGRLDALPRPGVELAGGDGGGWPRVVGFPTLAELARALGAPLYPRIVLLDPGERDGYLREWRPGGLPPERHVGYAVQWYALALTLLVAYLIVSLRERGAG
jgi:surfeit locus 1 family protein